MFKIQMLKIYSLNIDSIRLMYHFGWNFQRAIYHKNSETLLSISCIWFHKISYLGGSVDKFIRTCYMWFTFFNGLIKIQIFTVGTRIMTGWSTNSITICARWINIDRASWNRCIVDSINQVMCRILLLRVIRTNNYVCFITLIEKRSTLCGIVWSTLNEKPCKIHRRNLQRFGYNVFFFSIGTFSSSADSVVRCLVWALIDSRRYKYPRSNWFL